MILKNKEQQNNELFFKGIIIRGDENEINNDNDNNDNDNDI